MAFTAALCPVFQTALENIAKTNAGYLTRQPEGMIDMLLSPANRRGFQQIDVSNPNGGQRVVEFAYIQPEAVGNIVNSKPNICTTGTEVAPKSVIIDPFTQMVERWTPSMLLSEQEVTKLCFASPDEYRASMIMSRIDALMQSINLELVTQMSTQFGDFYNSTNAAVNAPLVLNADKSALLQGWITPVQTELSKIRYKGRPLVVGQGTYGIEYFTELLGIGCCNTNGINVSAGQGKYDFFVDMDVDSVWGANHFGVFVPGATQLVTFNQYKSTMRKMVDGFYEHDTIVDPFTGLELDFKLTYDNCAEAWKMALGLRFMLFTLPTDMYPAGAMNGVNNTLRFVATLV